MGSEEQFERALAYHCAPALAGIKPADLFSWLGTWEETGAMLARFSGELGRTGVRFCLLCRRRERCLIMVYRPERLAGQLAQEDVRAILRRDGYPVDGGTEVMLEHLGREMVRENGFPHEVGLFLGYPAEDVEGFRRNGGRGYRYCGLWKVYSDVEWARRRFEQYDLCRRGLCRQVQAGRHLAQMLRIQ